MGMFIDKDGEVNGFTVGAAIVIFFVALFMLFAYSPAVFIDAGERGVVLHFGAVTDKIMGEGLNWINPFGNSVKEMRVIQQKVEVDASAFSKDLQNVSSKISVNYNLDGNRVNKIYQNFRFEISSILISPAIHESLKATTAKFTAEELITKRESVKANFQSILKESLADNGVMITDVFIKDFDFSEEFNKAVEEKVTAEQQALKEKNNLAKVKYEAEQTIAKATADATSIKIKAQAVTQQGGKDYVQLMAIEKWDGHLPTQMIPGAAVPFIDLTKAK